MADLIPERAETKKAAIEFVEINIETEAATIEIVKNDDGSYMCTAGPHPE